MSIRIVTSQQSAIQAALDLTYRDFDMLQRLYDKARSDMEQDGVQITSDAIVTVRIEQAVKDD